MTSGITQRVLLIGPDDEERRALHLLVDRVGHEVAAADDLDAARRHLAGERADVILAASEIAVAAAAAGDLPPVIAVVRSRDLALSTTLLAGGVVDILTEPLDDLAIALALRRLAATSRAPRGDGAPAASPALVGDGEAMQKLKATIRMVGATRATVLVTGESGTGKELVARAIHDASPRRAQRFVAINCAAVPATLLESELFGHVRGAFTDAVRDRSGLFEEADGGTLFLDEVGELSLALQAKLLRVLQDSEIRRVGDTASVKVDVRLIAATLRDLAGDVADGRFREDLFYRLNVVPLHVPPLRERVEDIAQLARHFAARHSARHRRDVTLSEPAIAALAHQPWPGNVRELENVIERALVLAEGSTIELPFLATLMQLERADPEPDPELEPESEPAAADGEDGLSIKKATRSLEQDLIRRALGVTHGNRTNAAKLLEISHRALLYKMKEYGIS